MTWDLRPDVARLFVEGSDDGAVVTELVRKRLNVDLTRERKGNDYFIHAPSGAGGVDQVMQRLQVAIEKSSSLRRIGAVIDRDSLDGKADNWTRVRDLLSGLGIAVPEQPASTGFVADTSDGRRVGVWLMPDNVSPGDLESMLELLAPARPDWEWSLAATSRARELGATFRDVHARKARIHTWLAWQDAPGMPYGIALKAEHLDDAGNQTVKAFLDWFTALYATTD